jgi:hypothetical protein
VTRQGVATPAELEDDDGGLCEAVERLAAGVGAVERCFAYEVARGGGGVLDGRRRSGRWRKWSA